MRAWSMGIGIGVIVLAGCDGTSGPTVTIRPVTTHVVESEDNGAQLYLQAWVLLTPYAMDIEIVQGDGATEEQIRLAHRRLEMDSVRGGIDLLVEASRRPMCAFDVPDRFDDDPHVARSASWRGSTMARILLVDGARLEAQGDLLGAARGYASLIRAAAHAASAEEVWLDSMIRVAMAGAGAERLLELARTHDLPDGVLEEIEDARSRLNVEDPLGLRAALTRTLEDPPTAFFDPFPKAAIHEIERVLHAWTTSEDPIDALEALKAEYGALRNPPPPTGVYSRTAAELTVRVEEIRSMLDEALGD